MGLHVASSAPAAATAAVVGGGECPQPTGMAELHRSHTYAQYDSTAHLLEHQMPERGRPSHSYDTSSAAAGAAAHSPASAVQAAWFRDNLMAGYRTECSETCCLRSKLPQVS